MGIEWAHAETLAFGSLLREGFVIRLSGQDVAARHVQPAAPGAARPAQRRATYTPLTDLGDGRFEIYNSPLSEAAVLGYEYGYSVATERDLVLWEAQFGDFMNSAQVAIDQFIASGREKWDQLANLGLLLPHGYEGQGPEHSSARLERFLHAVRGRQHARALSDHTGAVLPHPPPPGAPAAGAADDRDDAQESAPAAGGLVTGARPGVGRLPSGHRGPDGRRRAKTRVRRLILCTGKIYYDLDAHESARSRRGRGDRSRRAALSVPGAGAGGAGERAARSSRR